MADCDETLHELETYLDHELTPDALRVIQAHIDGCLNCLQAYDFHAELRLIIADKCREEPLPPGLMAKIEECFGPVGPEDPGPADQSLR
jgi:mycothiol system anti-sigma-R factor